MKPTLLWHHYPEVFLQHIMGLCSNGLFYGSLAENTSYVNVSSFQIKTPDL